MLRTNLGGGSSTELSFLGSSQAIPKSLERSAQPQTRASLSLLGQKGPSRGFSRLSDEVPSRALGADDVPHPNVTLPTQPGDWTCGSEDCACRYVNSASSASCAICGASRASAAVVADLPPSPGEQDITRPLADDFPPVPIEQPRNMGISEIGRAGPPGLGPPWQIRVGNLSPDLNESDLVTFFQSEFHPHSCIGALFLPAPLTVHDISAREAIVEFPKRSEMEDALRLMQGVYCRSRPMHITRILPTSGAPRLPSARTPAPDGIVKGSNDSPSKMKQHMLAPMSAAPMNQFTDPKNTTVFVGGLSVHVTEDELRSFFQGFGEIAYVKIPLGKGCGFVQFVQRHAAEMAINQMQGYPIGNSRVRLSWGRSQNISGEAGTPEQPLQPQQQAPPEAQFHEQSSGQVSSYWSVSEQNQFVLLLGQYGTNWNSIADALDSKTTIMVKNYYNRKLDEGLTDFEEIAREADQKNVRVLTRHRLGRKYKACLCCRKEKRRCKGEKPRCSTCTRLRRECTYPSEETSRADGRLHLYGKVKNPDSDSYSSEKASLNKRKREDAEILNRLVSNTSEVQMQSLGDSRHVGSGFSVSFARTVHAAIKGSDSTSGVSFARTVHAAVKNSYNGTEPSISQGYQAKKPRTISGDTFKNQNSFSISCTISEDRSGGQESVLCARLAVLGSYNDAGLDITSYKNKEQKAVPLSRSHVIS